MKIFQACAIEDNDQKIKEEAKKYEECNEEYVLISALVGSVLLGPKMNPFLPHLLYSFCLILPYFYAPNRFFSFIEALILHRYDYLLFYHINTYDCNKQGFTS